MTEIKVIKIYSDSIVYDLGERSIHDFHGNGTIGDDDKICLKDDPQRCGSLNFPRPSAEDDAVVRQFRQSHADYVNQVVSLAKKRFGKNISWQKEGDFQVASLSVEQGTLKITDRQGDRQIDIFEFIPASPNPQNAFDVGVKILRDYSDEAFDHKEDRPVKNPLSVPYLNLLLQ